jgi:cohesin complex subunit SA-1/2
MHRYRDVDPEIRMACIRAIGSWIVSYPSLFLQDLYLKYIGWTLNDKVCLKINTYIPNICSGWMPFMSAIVFLVQNPAVRKTSIIALQKLYEVDDNVPSLSLFTERFCSRMIEMADDIDISVAVTAIGLLKHLLRYEIISIQIKYFGNCNC